MSTVLREIGLRYRESLDGFKSTYDPSYTPSDRIPCGTCELDPDFHESYCNTCTYKAKVSEEKGEDLPKAAPRGTLWGLLSELFK